MCPQKTFQVTVTHMKCGIDSGSSYLVKIYLFYVKHMTTLV